MHSKTKVKKNIQKYVYARNRCHYLKWRLDSVNDWSIRFFFIYDTRVQYTKQWVLKSHQNKDYIILTKNEAIEYLQKFAISIQPEEIFSANEFGCGYRKLNIHPRGTSTYLDKLI